MDPFAFIAGVVISAIISAICSESILKGIGQLLAKIDLPSNADIEGIWHSTFTLEEEGVVNTYFETIKIVKRLGRVYRYNIPDERNHEMLKRVEHSKPFRLRANLVDNRFFTGVWFNPSKKSRYHGSFQLLYSLCGTKMTGVWTGYSDTDNCIKSGTWNWKKG